VQLGLIKVWDEFGFGSYVNKKAGYSELDMVKTNSEKSNYLILNKEGLLKKNLIIQKYNTPIWRGKIWN